MLIEAPSKKLSLRQELNLTIQVISDKLYITLIKVADLSDRIMISYFFKKIND